MPPPLPLLRVRRQRRSHAPLNPGSQGQARPLCPPGGPSQAGPLAARRVTRGAGAGAGAGRLPKSLILAPILSAPRSQPPPPPRPPGISGSAHRYSCLGPARIAGHDCGVQYWCERAPCSSAAASRKSTVWRASHSFSSSAVAASPFSSPFSLSRCSPPPPPPLPPPPTGQRADLVTAASETEPRVAPGARESTAAAAAATPSTGSEVEHVGFDAPDAPAPALAAASSAPSSPPLKTPARRKGLAAGRRVAAAPALLWCESRNGGKRGRGRERERGEEKNGFVLLCVSEEGGGASSPRFEAGEGRRR